MIRVKENYNSMILLTKKSGQLRRISLGLRASSGFNTQIHQGLHGQTYFK